MIQKAVIETDYQSVSVTAFYNIQNSTKKEAVALRNPATIYRKSSFFLYIVYYFLIETASFLKLTARYLCSQRQFLLIAPVHYISNLRTAAGFC